MGQLVPKVRLKTLDSIRKDQSRAPSNRIDSQVKFRQKVKHLILIMQISFIVRSDQMTSHITRRIRYRGSSNCLSYINTITHISNYTNFGVEMLTLRVLSTLLYLKLSLPHQKSSFSQHLIFLAPPQTLEPLLGKIDKDKIKEHNHNTKT